MSVNSVNSTDYWKTPTSSESLDTGTEGFSDFDSFVTLLASELSNQDPLDPVDTTEYVSQMSQISMLEQMQDMNTSLEELQEVSIGSYQQLQDIGTSLEQLQSSNTALLNYQALNLLDREVTYETTDDSGEITTATGKVEGVGISSGEVLITIEGTKISYDSIITVNSSE